MNDYELLKLAAKANGELYTEPLGDGLALANGQAWNPLTDDGDALRLAVKLRFEIDIGHTGIAVRTPNGIKILVSSKEEPDAYKATRRAIVRAAAEIGRNIK